MQTLALPGTALSGNGSGSCGTGEPLRRERGPSAGLFGRTVAGPRSALPAILGGALPVRFGMRACGEHLADTVTVGRLDRERQAVVVDVDFVARLWHATDAVVDQPTHRSEERRVGKECRS